MASLRVYISTATLSTPHNTELPSTTILSQYTIKLCLNNTTPSTISRHNNTFTTLPSTPKISNIHSCPSQHLNSTLTTNLQITLPYTIFQQQTSIYKINLEKKWDKNRTDKIYAFFQYVTSFFLVFTVRWASDGPCDVSQGQVIRFRRRGCGGRGGGVRFSTWPAVGGKGS